MASIADTNIMRQLEAKLARQLAAVEATRQQIEINKAYLTKQATK